METRSEKMNAEELQEVKELLAGSFYLFNRAIAVICIIIAILIVRFEEGVISIETDQLALWLTISAVILYLIYAPLLIIPDKKADLKYKIKKIGIVKVKEIKELSLQDKKDVLGTADYIIKFEPNPFKIEDTYFLSSREPELLNAKAYQVEVSKHAKIEFKREIIEI